MPVDNTGACKKYGVLELKVTYEIQNKPLCINTF